MSDRLYDIIHEVNSNNYQIYSDKIEYSILYPNPNNSFSDIVNNNYFKLENIYPNIDIVLELGNYILNNIFYLHADITQIKTQLSLPTDVVLEKISDQFISVNRGENKLLTLTSSSLVDDIKNNAPLPKLSFEQNNNIWTIIIDIDEEWIKDISRIFPIVYTLGTSFSILPSMASMSIKALSTGTDQVYRDTRPDSATQFYVTLYDDSEFRRPRAIYQGMPVCSTVPYAVGDIYDLNTIDISQWYEGLGNESRNVYLQIIASKVLDANQSITYDVLLPGTIDYLNQQAEFVDTMDGLPIYRGVFSIYKNNAPAYVDGIGYINVRLSESRYSALSSRVKVLSVNSSTLYSDFSVIGTYGISKLDGNITIHALGRAFLISRMSVDAHIGVSVLNSRATVTGSPYTVEPWYDAGEWSEIQEAAMQRQMNSDTITDYPESFYKVTMNLTNGSALDSNGYVWSWGTVLYLGNGTPIDPTQNFSPIQLDTTYVFTDIEMGQGNSTFTIALNSSNEVWGWGVDTHGIFGLSSSSDVPVKISGAAAFRYISTGSNFVACVDGLNKIYWWGDVLNAGTNITSPTICADLSLLSFDRVCAGDTFILGHNTLTGEVYKVGSFGAEVASAGVLISGVHAFTKVVAYSDHAIGLKADGTVWGWGVNYNNCLGYVFPATNYTTDPIQISDIPISVTDIATGKYYSSFIGSGDIYVLGYSSINYYKYSGLGTGANIVRETRSSANIIQKVRPTSSWARVFNGYSISIAIDTSGKIYLYGEDSYPMYQQILRYNRSVPYQLRFKAQDMWGGNVEQEYTDPLGTQIALPKLFTYLTRTDVVGPSRFSMNATELIDHSTSYIAAKMNSISGVSDGTLTKWDLYYNAIQLYPEYRESSSFEYLYMMMNAESYGYSDFKQRSYYPYDKIASGTTNYPFAFNSTDRSFYIDINYIINNIPNALSPFDSDYALKLNNWSENFDSASAKIGVSIDLYDETSGICYGNSMKIKNITDNINLVTFQFGRNDFTPSPLSASAWVGPGETYPIKVKILIQPDLKLYKISGATNYSFVSPQSWIEITNIKINPYSS